MRIKLNSTAVTVVAALFGGALMSGVVIAATTAGTEPQCIGTACVEQHEIASRAVTADKLGSGDLTSFVEDGSFERTPANQLPVSRSWPIRVGSPAWQVVQGGTACFQGTRCAKRTGNGTASAARLANAVEVDVYPGQQLFAEAFMRSEGGANGTGGLVLDMLSATGSVVSSSGGTSFSPSSWTPFRSVVTVPTGTTRARVALVVTNHSAGAWVADAVVLRRLHGASDLRDGAVSSTKLGGSAVDSSKVRDGTLTLADLLLSSIDGRYVPRTSLTGGTPNTAGNPVSWGRLYNMPGGFADGIDHDRNPIGYEGRKQQASFCTDYCTQAQLSLPAGAFTVTARLIAAQNDMTKNLAGWCRLTFGGRTDAIWVLSPSADIPVTLTVMGSQAVAGPAVLSCKDNQNGDVLAINMAISALPLHSFTSVVMS